MQMSMVSHPIGRLSKCAVLDIGLKCPHSCEFCYYSFLDGSDNQFRGMRNATFRPLAECKQALDFFAESGFERIDITGGEPAFHPDIFEIVRYAENVAGLRVRMITLAQLFERKDKHTGKRLLDALLDDAGLTDLLISLHAVNPEIYHQITKGRFSRVEGVLDELDSRGFSYCTNTVACASNANHLPEIASYLVERHRRVYVSNFITMNAYMAWSGRAFGVQARYSELAGPLRAAVSTLEGAGIGVNVRYGPYCVLKGLEKNLVGISGVVFDPFEWRNSTRNPFIVLANEEAEAFALQRRQLTVNGKSFDEKCEGCALRPICDGVDTNYLREHGNDELIPYAGPPVDDVVHFRRQNPAVFRQKQKAGRAAKAARVAPPAVRLSDWRSLVTGLQHVYEHKLHWRHYLAESGGRPLTAGKLEWVDATKWTGEPNRALVLSPGSAAEFRTVANRGSSLRCRMRTVTGGAARAEMQVTVCASGDDDSARLSRRLAINGRWKRVRLPLETEGEELRLRIECVASGGDSPVAILEPCVMRPRGAGYAARLVFRNLRHLGVRACLKKVRAWARCGVREVQAG